MSAAHQHGILQLGRVVRQRQLLAVQCVRGGQAGPVGFQLGPALHVMQALPQQLHRQLLQGRHISSRALVLALVSRKAAAMGSSAIWPGQNWRNKRNSASGAAGAAAAAAPAAHRATFLAAGHYFGARTALWLLTLDDAAPATGTSVLVAKAGDWRKKLTSAPDAAGDAAAAPPDPAVGSSVASPGSPPHVCASN